MVCNKMLLKPNNSELDFILQLFRNVVTIVINVNYHHQCNR